MAIRTLTDALSAAEKQKHKMLQLRAGRLREKINRHKGLLAEMDRELVSVERTLVDLETLDLFDAQSV